MLNGDSNHILMSIYCKVLEGVSGEDYVVDSYNPEATIPEQDEYTEETYDE